MARIQPVTVPKWGLSMEKGTLSAWRKQVGDRVAAGDELCDLESEKITGSLESPASGVLRRRLAEEGAELPVGALLGVVAEEGASEAEIDAVVAAFQEGFKPEAAAAAIGVAEPEKVEVGGRRLRYLRRGPAGASGAGGTPVLLLHGFGGDLGNWLFNQEPLAATRAVYALDLPGHGESSKDVGDGTLEDLAVAVIALLDKLALGPVHLVGHSMGGAVALAMAAADPARVRSLSLIASAGLGPGINAAYLEAFVGANSRSALRPALAQLFADEALVSRQLVDDLLKYKRLEGVEAALRKLLAGFVAGGVQTRSFRDLLGRMRAPALVIWGGKDQIIPAAQAAGLPASVRVEILPEAGHMVQMEAAGAVNRLLNGFLA